MRRVLELPFALTLGLGLALAPGCGDDASEEEAAQADAAADEGEEQPVEEPAAEPEPEPEGADLPEGIERFEHWSPQHAFINAPVVRGHVVSDTELIVATGDAHVGVSTDGGESWRWTKAGDAVVDVTGYPGGPYVALHEGAISVSSDGLRWSRSPRWTADRLVDVVAASIGLVAIGKAGAWVHFDEQGVGVAAGQLPNNFKAKALTELNGAVLAWAGKSGYGTTNGADWTELELVPPMPDARTHLTSAGTCTLGRVGKAKGVTCSVSGTAFGMDGAFAVENRGVVSLTTDGGASWTTAALPFRGANSIFGDASAYYALGNGGNIAISKDGGATWVDQRWEESANLADGVVAGSDVVIVGSRGALIYSNDGAQSWDFAEAPAGSNFNWVGRLDGEFIASDGRTFLASEHGAEWTVLEEAIELPGKFGACADLDGGQPAEGESCRYAATITSPEGSPNVRALTFTGDTGLAMGDDGLVAVSHDGGASWATAHGLGYGRKGATDFSVRGQTLVATNGARLSTSIDGGATWVEGGLVGRPRINAVHASAIGPRLAVGKGTILVSRTDPSIWLTIEDLPKGDWIAIHEVGGALYAADLRGGLLRSEDGVAWTPLVTGLSAPVVDMAGEGEIVWARTAAPRRGPELLLRSEDGGAHFIVVGATVGYGQLRVVDGAIRHGDLESKDQGKTWRAVEGQLPGEPLEDGSGMTMTRRSRYDSPDFLVLHKAKAGGESERIVISSAHVDGGQIDCDAETGCWLLSRGVVYRPLGR
ncbi:hypothetical protein PPSIR1_38961 [Plesiocystis pacifica SIR-1]|uniref:Photosynthesis system II assembly factor Ycf48/Hcf136-like domain-containing protein n=1 Tax=Plesiocystis pacifica SIR-1 TaxID=391625 RepID=A6GGE3_9BACT|nr:hypothetical protein [Plesiocystis pacifica]EDM75064.1 hypothetical protein PPSIR1_38961 [Plesiocystis pacifica SIR-1]